MPRERKLIQLEVMTPRERQVYELRQKGLSNEQVAERLGLKQASVRATMVVARQKSVMQPSKSRES